MTEPKPMTLDARSAKYFESKYEGLPMMSSSLDDAFKAGWKECHAEDMKTISALEEKLRIACECCIFYSNDDAYLDTHDQLDWDGVNHTAHRQDKGNRARVALAKIKGVK